MPEFVPNLRDLGGLPAADDSVTASGVLLRSAVPAATDVVADEIAWPPAQVIDLRSPLETGPDHPLDGVAGVVHRISLLEALRPELQHPDPDAIERMRSGGLTSLYLGMLEVARAEIVRVVRLVADHPGPTLVHCAAGKDRTGVVVALILRTVGVSREDVIEDYLETGRAAEEISRRLATQPIIDPARPVPPSYLELPVDAIGAVLGALDAHPRGASGWLEMASPDTDLAERLRDRLLA